LQAEVADLAKQTEQQCLLPAAKSLLTRQTKTVQMNCVQINGIAAECWRKNDIYQSSPNPFVKNYWLANGEDRFQMTEAAADFLKQQDQAFSRRLHKMLKTNLRGELNDLRTTDVYLDQGIANPQIFASKQLNQLRQIECALLLMKNSGYPLKKLQHADGKFYEQNENQYIDSDSKQRQIKLHGQEAIKTSEDLRLAMSVLLSKLDAIHIAYPLHKRLEHMIRETAAQVKLLGEYAKLFTKFPPAFINASTQNRQ